MKPHATRSDVNRAASPRYRAAVGRGEDGGRTRGPAHFAGPRPAGARYRVRHFFHLTAPAGTRRARSIGAARHAIYRARPTIVRTGLRNRGISRSRDPPPVVIGVPIAQGPTIGNELMIVTDTNPPRTATRLLVLTILHVHERRPDARHPTSIGVFTRALSLSC